MRRISKHCKTLQSAERHHRRLLNRHPTVRLLQCPLFGEAGTYIWLVE